MTEADEKEISERVMSNEEVRDILQDPINREILQQMQQDLAAANEFVLFLKISETLIIKN